ncbi:hypothetical protein M434DRAFT_376993 [Hypoxylon sp. CO27-5]|nr:hypothetical protein M434DRAFT_376993 [Hypoxylon sp. CO27-5]
MIFRNTISTKILKASANGSNVSGNSKLLLDSSTWNSNNSQKKESWKIVLSIGALFSAVAIAGIVIAYQSSKSGHDPASTTRGSDQKTLDPSSLSSPLLSSSSSLSSSLSPAHSTSTSESLTLTRGPISTPSTTSQMSLQSIPAPAITTAAAVTRLLPGQACKTDTECYPNIMLRISTIHHPCRVDMLFDSNSRHF